MVIDFYLDNEQRAPTVGFYLFTDYFSEIRNGQQIKHMDQNYQVTWQTVAENKGEPHMVFLYPIERSIITIDFKIEENEKD